MGCKAGSREGGKPMRYCRRQSGGKGSKEYVFADGLDIECEK